MNATTRAAFYRFGIPRRRKAVGKAREVRVEPTPETLAKRRFPVWNAWHSELQLAAFQIDLAVRLLAGASVCQAQDLMHVSKAAQPDWTRAQRHAVERYRGWTALMARIRWPLQPVLDAVVHGQHPGDEWLLKRALHLHATGQILTGIGDGRGG